jgi:hypothetical protein
VALSQRIEGQAIELRRPLASDELRMFAGCDKERPT